MDALLRDLLDQVIEALPTAALEPRPAPELGDRRGWFHASDLKGGSIPFDPSFCVAQYLGLAPRPTFTPEAALAVGLGRGLDRLLDAALQRCPSVGTTQADLRDATLRLRGTPDFLYQPWGELLPGEVKSCGPQTFARFWANPDWPVGRAYFHRQLQAYMMLATADRAVLVVVNRAGCERGDTIRDCLSARWVYADAVTQAGIRRDLAYLLRCVEEHGRHSA